MRRMDMDSNSSTPSTQLRRRAEERLALRAPLNTTAMSAADVQRLIHDLQISQIEMEIQNEELKRLQLESEASKKKYQDLYDFAPVGCVSIYHSDGSMRLRQNEN